MKVLAMTDKSAGGQETPAAPTAARSAARDPDADADLQIARRAGAGDMGAFDALVSLYNARVFGVAFRMLQDRGEAEDLTQEVFVAVYHALPEFRAESKLSTWIYRITKNRCLNRIKFLKRRHIGRHYDVDDASLASYTRDPKDEQRDPRRLLEAQEVSALINRGLSALSEDQRELIVLRDLEQLTYEEITDITGLQLGTVKSRLHRARARLAKVLRPLALAQGHLPAAAHEVSP